MSIQISSRTKAMQPSATLAFNDRMMAMRKKDPSTISFGVGEPDLPTPEHIKQAARKAMVENRTRYTSAGGMAELKDAVSMKYKRDNGLDYGPDQVMVAPGAKQVIGMALLSLCDPGDEVLVPCPYWISFIDQIRFASGEPIPVPTRQDEGFVPHADVIADHVTERTRAIILNTPNNPTGAVYPRAELERIADVCVENDIVVIADSLYESLVFGGAEHVPIASLGEEINDLTLTVAGVSKSYCMTGWRVGFGGGPVDLIKALTKINGQLSTCANSIAQWAALEALTGPQEPLKVIADEFAARRDLAIKLLGEVDGISFAPPMGAFYIYINCSELFGRTAGNTTLNNATDVSNYFIDEARIGLIPSTVFGDTGHLRLAYTTSQEDLAEGVQRMDSAIAKLK
ncbi:MAG: pyridoxal phosphate-dependent aminotransferase [Candidatus Undinarchaeales archaeon]|jgi:aspartate aminotransferase|nr:pyridoxal phosphate-dependent aminotransferase [Candidatus Undinarchaeales archaeon]MDP7494011.1 pyridoxal phosphate-dependent aminotransferase [Candidatus Undinarchaeales archaeon]